MQKVQYKGAVINVPAGWSAMRPGTRVCSGDKYFSWDDACWKDVSYMDMGTRVKDIPDIVIRKRTNNKKAFTYRRNTYCFILTDSIVG